MVIFLGSLITNFITLFLVASKSARGIKIFLNPAFIFGDFLFLPLYLMFAESFFRTNLKILEVNSLFISCIIALIFTIGMGIKYKLIKMIWIPHGLFVWIVISSYILMVITTIIDNRDLTSVAISSFLLSGHWLLGNIFPKKIDFRY